MITWYSEVGRRQWASGCGGSGSGGGQKQQQQRNDETITMRMIGKSDGAFLGKGALEDRSYVVS